MTKRMIDASSAALSRSPSSSLLVGDDLKAFLLLEQVQRVRADAEMLFDLALHRLARREDRLQLEIGDRAQAVEARAWQRAG